MAIFYYPAGSNLSYNNAWNPGYEQLTIACNPNMVFYFDTGSQLNVASASFLYITASWAHTASVTVLFSSTSVSSSYASTASYALNAAAGGGGVGMTNSMSFSTILTSSTRWITASFSEAEQTVNITLGQLYNFTCSNLPSASQVAWTSLYLNNTALTTCSLSFPSTWVFMGYAPSSLSSSRSATLTLKSYGAAPIVAAFAVQY